jgi:hypothetical protein
VSYSASLPPDVGCEATDFPGPLVRPAEEQLADAKADAKALRYPPECSTSFIILSLFAIYSALMGGAYSGRWSPQWHCGATAGNGVAQRTPLIIRRGPIPQSDELGVHVGAGVGLSLQYFTCGDGS